MKECWKEIIDTDLISKYYISNKGNVKNQKGLILKQRCDKYGYKRISFSCYKNGVKYAKTIYIHRLVANAFIDNNDGFKCVSFKDQNRENVVVENLFWCNKPKRPSKTKISNRNRSVINITTGEIFNNISEASRATGIKLNAIQHCCMGNHTTAGNYKWSYLI